MIDLQQARRKAAQRFFKLGMDCLPVGWTFAYRKALTGICMLDSKHIVAPRPVTRKSLYIWLHECAHAHLHSAKKGKKRHVEEMEAEQWAHARMRENGIPVPRSMTVRAKAHVARKIRQAERRGAKHIDPASRKFATRRKP